MALRLVELILPEENAATAITVFEERETLGFWKDSIADGRVLFRVLVSTEHSEGLMDELELFFSGCDGYRVMLLAVEATLPRPEVPKLDTEEEPKEPAPATNGKKIPMRISREELYTDLSQEANLTYNYAVRVILSTAVAAIGLIKGDVAIIIGAMVIAPLLGSNMSLALATTLGDRDLAFRSIKTAATGLAIAFGLSLLCGFFLRVNTMVPEINARTQVGLGHVVLALASGCAGALAFTQGMSSALVGVMVAVALLPPLVVAGLLTATGSHAATGALLLLATNLICVNLAAVGTFLAQGIHPRAWWEAEKAKRAARRALIAWTVMLLLLVLVIIAIERWL